MANVRVTVRPGRVVRYNKKTISPGKIFSCSEDEATRLQAQGIVDIMKKKEQSGNAEENRQ